MGSTAARRQHDMAEFHLHELRLIEHLAGRFHIAQGADPIRSADGNAIGFAARAAALPGDVGHRVERVDIARDQPDLGAEQTVEQNIAAVMIEVASPGTESVRTRMHRRLSRAAAAAVCRA